jgi:hypothetical protein
VAYKLAHTFESLFGIEVDLLRLGDLFEKFLDNHPVVVSSLTKINVLSYTHR